MGKLKDLQILDTVVGEGNTVKPGNVVSIHYTGRLMSNGQKFDSSVDRNQPFETQIGVGILIRGWDVGIVGMQVGGKRTLDIPSDMAYGTRGAPGSIIGPNEDLTFDVELLAIR
jgi:FKBP-type peptidyl-prolyl cis-trans isomerase FkpA